MMKTRWIRLQCVGCPPFACCTFHVSASSPSYCPRSNAFGRSVYCILQLTGIFTSILNLLQLLWVWIKTFLENATELTGFGPIKVQFVPFTLNRLPQERATKLSVVQIKPKSCPECSLKPSYLKPNLTVSSIELLLDKTSSGHSEIPATIRLMSWQEKAHPSQQNSNVFQLRLLAFYYCITVPRRTLCERWAPFLLARSQDQQPAISL